MIRDPRAAAPRHPSKGRLCVPAKLARQRRLPLRELGYLLGFAAMIAAILAVAVLA